MFGAYVYAVRVIGPVVIKSGPVITTKQRNAFVAGVLLLWIGSDWPVHDLAEEYLYSMHMFQHMALSYFMPPLVLLAIPKWMRLKSPWAYKISTCGDHKYKFN